MRKEFTSPTKGPMSLQEVFADILLYVTDEPHMDYRLIIGTDSQPRRKMSALSAPLLYTARVKEPAISITKDIYIGLCR